MIDRIRSLGVVGAGGAGFPAYKKLEAEAEIVIQNAAECEPLLHKDKEILRLFGADVLAGMRAVMDRVGASKGIVGIKEKYVDLIAELTELGRPLGIDVHPLGDFYPAGDEFITVFETTGRVIPPGGIPLDVGCLVMNSETMLNIHRDAPVTHKYFTVCGDVPEPMTVFAPVGMSFRDVLVSCGVDPEGIGTLLVGGVMMGKRAETLDDVVTRTTGGLICLPEGHGLGTRYRTEAPARDRIAKSACDQCSFCTELCPRYLLGHPVEPHLAMRGLEFNMVGDSMVLGSQFCCECNLCSLYSCPEDLYPKDACADNKVMMRQKQLSHPAKGDTSLRPHSMQAFRHIPVKSLMKKLGLTQFRNVGPMTEVDWHLAEVRIPLGMHIGAPAVPVVEKGDRVAIGQEIAKAPEGLGVAIHASVAGTVAEVGTEVVIRCA